MFFDYVIVDVAMTASDIIATCSAFVASFAFVATAYQAWIARHHNRLSVRPHLVWHIHRRNAPSGAGVIYSVRNLGLGPAVVTDRYFTKDEIRFVPSGQSVDEVPDFLKYVINGKFNYDLKIYGLPGKNSAIPSQEEVVIADIVLPEHSLDQLADLEEVVGQIAFHIDYESLYGERFNLHVL